MKVSHSGNAKNDGQTCLGARLRDESGIIVFGGGGGGRGCSGRGCLFWIVVSVVLSVTLTILVNLVLLLFSGGGSAINV